MIKKFGKLAHYKMYMKLMKEDNVLDKPEDDATDIVDPDEDSSNDLHSIEEPEVNKAEPGVFKSDNEDLLKIHSKLMTQFVPSQLIYDNKGK
jgi:hypothetical protein